MTKSDQDVTVAVYLNPPDSPRQLADDRFLAGTCSERVVKDRKQPVAQIPPLSEIERSADLTSCQRSVAGQSGRTVGVHRDREANDAQEISQNLPKTRASLDVLRITRSF